MKILLTIGLIVVVLGVVWQLRKLRDKDEDDIAW